MAIVSPFTTGPKGSLEVLAMLDSVSTLTVINSKIADQLGLKGPVKSLTHSGLYEAITVPDSRNVSVTIAGASGKRFDLKNVRTVPSLSLPRQSVQRATLRKWKHLQKLNIEEYGSDRPTILIGQDNVELCNTLELVGGPPNAPMAGRTELGWLLMGRVARGDVPGFSYHVREDSEDSLHQLVKEHFTNESFGVKPNVISPRSREDARAMEIMDRELKRVEDGWEAGLLWKSDDPVLPHTRKTALSRLRLMERKMDQDPVFAETYEEKMSYYIKNRFAVKLTPEEAAVVTSKTYYLSHFLAKNPKKQNKYRLVFDAKAKEEGVSLNDMLLIGPDQLVPLPEVLSKFRERKIGVTADIKDMFHRVKVKREDAVAQRFLLRGMRRDGDPDVYEMRVLIFGAACSPALAQEVKNRNAKEFHEEFPESSEVSVERIYMDDYTDSVDTVDEAKQRFTETRTVMSSGGFDLGKWGSNSKEFLDSIPEELKTNCVKSLSLGEASVERVLGLFWNQQTDKFTFSLTYLKAKEGVLNGSVRPTKREVLALVMSIFDPLGFLSVYTVRAKMLLQDLWRSQIGWDDEVPSTINDKWSSWISQLKKIPEFQLDRCYSPDFSTAERITLHVFVDASEKAYGAVAYFVTEKNGRKSTALVTSKSRVAPTKPLSIPRMELQAAVMGSRLGKSICDSHSVPVTRRVYWSDSRTVLCWINSDGRKFQPFVSHRIGDIQELTDVTEWRWVPTKQNVADELTRDIDECEWGPDSRWINGPSVIVDEEGNWPKQAKVHNGEDGDALELKKEYVLAVSNAPSTLIDIPAFSSYTRLRNVVARVLDAVQRFKKRLNRSNGVSATKTPLVLLQRQAEQLLQRKSQEESYGQTLEALKRGLPVPKESPLCRLNVVLDGDGLLRLEGRLGKCVNADDGVKSPVVLDRKNPYTKFLLAHFHERSGHYGQEQVVNEERQSYFIPRIRSAVRATWMHCKKCKNDRAVPSPPQMGQLPPQRVECFVFPFKNTGLDYFGPTEVTVRRSHEKRWVAILTCLSTRAVHVEIAASLSTDSCIQAIRRFVGRRGSPEHLFSDNGTNFHGSNNELKRALSELNQCQMEEACSVKGIAWHFNPPAAPHMGGSWERLVRSIKIALKSTLKERYPKEETFHTLLVEAEHSVNSHPLTHVSVDPEDPEALTPNHFLIGRSSNVVPVGIFGRDDLFGRKQWSQAQQLSDSFWKRWMKEYLPSLQRRTKWLQPSKSIAVGDIVVEVDPQQPRNTWPKGVVEEVFPGADGVVRVVEIRTAKGRYRRPVVKIAVLDVQKEEDSAPEVKFGVPTLQTEWKNVRQIPQPCHPSPNN